MPARGENSALYETYHQKGSAMQHIRVPVSEIMILIVNPEVARISNDESHMMAIVDNELHILVGDFKGIDSSGDLEEIIKRNLKN